MSGRRNRVRKQVTEAKEGPLGLRRENSKGNALGWGGGGGVGERKGTGKAREHSPKRAHAGSSILRAFKSEDFRGGPREHLSRIFTSFPCVSFQGRDLL